MMITRTLNATYLILPLTNIHITVTVHKPMEIVGSLSMPILFIIICRIQCTYESCYETFENVLAVYQ